MNPTPSQDSQQPMQAEPFEETIEAFRKRVMWMGGSVQEHYVLRKIDELKEEIERFHSQYECLVELHQKEIEDLEAQQAIRPDAERVIELEKKVEELRKENMDYDYSLTIAKERIAELEKDNVDLLHNLTNYNFRIAELEKQVAAKDEALKWCSEVATNLFNDEYSKDCIRDQYVGIMRRSNEAITSAKSILSGSASEVKVKVENNDRITKAACEDSVDHNEDSRGMVSRDDLERARKEEGHFWCLKLDIAIKALERIASSGWTKGNIPSEEANELCYLAGKALAQVKGME